MKKNKASTIDYSNQLEAKLKRINELELLTIIMLDDDFINKLRKTESNAEWRKVILRTLIEIKQDEKQ